MKILFVIFITLSVASVDAQQNPQPVLTFDFNDHTFNESQSRVKTRSVGASLVEDRFGNEKSALYVHGHQSSYLVLGPSPLLTPEKGTFSVWVKLERKVYNGKGYEGNPILAARNSKGIDFYDGYSLFYDFKSERLMIFFSKDSNGTEQAGVNSLETMVFNEWHHLVFSYDNHKIKFYINGVKQGECQKNFKSVFLKDEPVFVGNGNSTKNVRCSRGSVDDIRIYNKVLSHQEIIDLYNEPNPNKAWLLFTAVLKWVGIACGIVLIAFLLVWQRRRSLKRVREKLETERKLHQMEIRTLKAQMNPHFIFNSLNSIQQFIMTNDNEQAQAYLAKFAKLMRKLLESNVNESLSIEEEVDILNAYMELEALRFRQSFAFKITVDPEIDAADTYIPHLLVQPFVENAIWHGLLPKKEKRELLISFERVDERTLRCIIDDNGIGREASSKKEPTFKKKSLALSFVQQRLDVLAKTAGVDCKVEIIDKTERGRANGTRVNVIIPVLTKHEAV
ncbi:MAG TPA: histidine kinase [Flavobacteriales bacterium]|nr:histidine kinase [Flavobacteriales bacterium]